MRSTTTRIAVDVGGTFVDALALDPAGGLRWAKVPNSGGDPRACASEEDVRSFFARYGSWQGLAAVHVGAI